MKIWFVLLLADWFKYMEFLKKFENEHIVSEIYLAASPY